MKKDTEVISISRACESLKLPQSNKEFSQSSLLILAKEAGAEVKAGNRSLIDVEKLKNYIKRLGNEGIRIVLKRKMRLIDLETILKRGCEFCFHSSELGGRIVSWETPAKK